MRSALTPVVRRMAPAMYAHVAVLAAVWPLTSVTNGTGVLTFVLIPTIVSFWWQVWARQLSIMPWVVNAISAIATIVWAFVWPAGLSIGALVDGTSRGLHRILSTNFPLIDPRWPMVALVLLASAAGATTGAAAVRRESMQVPIVVTATFVVAFTLVIGGISGPVTRAFVLPACVGLAAVVMYLAYGSSPVRATVGREPENHDGPGHQATRALASVTVSVLVAWVSLVQVPGLAGDPVLPRLTPKVTDRTPESPLLVVQRLRQSAEQTPVVGLRRVQSPYVHLGTLSNYDGRTWDSAVRFQTSNGIVNTSPAGGDPAPSQSFSLSSIDLDLTGGWMPFVGRPVRFGENTNVLIPFASDSIGFIPETSSRGKTQMTGTTFDVPVLTSASEVPDKYENVLIPTIDAPSDPQGPAMRTCAVTLNRIRRDDAQWTLRPDKPSPRCGTREELSVQDVARLLEAVATGRSRLDDTEQDSSQLATEYLPTVLTLMGADRTTNSDARAGSPEQFATAGALLLQALGVPAVVATGFRNGDDRGVVTANEGWTWIEVPLDEGRWIGFDASPTDTTKIAAVTSTTLPPASTSTIAPTTTAASTSPPATNRVSPILNRSQGISSLAVALLGIAGLCVFLVGLRSVSNKRRRRGRMSGGPRRAMIGAWQNLLETAYAAGLRSQTALSATEVIDNIGRELNVVMDQGTSMALANGANAAVFGMAEPPPDEAAAFVNVMTSLEKHVRKSMSPPKKLLSWARPIPDRMLSRPLGSPAPVRRRLRLRTN